MKKGLKLTMALLLSMSVLASACSNTQEPNANNGTTANEEKPNGSNSGEKVNEQTVEGLNKEGFPIVNEPITLKMFSRIAPISAPNEELLVWQEYEKMTGIKIEFEDVPTEGFAERKNLVFAANELPDFFFRSMISPMESIKYGTNGQLIPLEGLIEEYAPNFKALLEKYPEIKSDITFPDGHIYTLPMVVTNNASLTGQKNWINKALLDKLGLPMPETTEDLINVLKAFRDSGEGIIPLSNQKPANAKGELLLVDQFTGSFGLDKQFEYNVNLEDGKIKLWVTDDRYKALLQFLNQLWTEKLIDREYFTHTNAEYIAKMTSGKLGLFAWGNNNPFTALSDQYVGMSPVEGPFGDRMYSNTKPMASAFGAFAITNANEHPEATMRWLDYFYGTEGSTFVRYGVEGQSFHYDENKEAIYNDEIMKAKSPDAAACATVTPFCGGAFPHLLHDKNDSLVNNEATMAAQATLDPYLPKVRYGPLLFTEADAKQVEILRGDIDTYVQEQSTKFITGAIGFDQWDTYVKTLEKMNIAQLEEMYQKTFDSKK